jgi:histidinol-phosphatase (PHP family)
MADATRTTNAPIGDYHVHSRFSDGRDGLRANVARAERLGLAEIGLSDHLAPDFGVGGALDDYVRAVRGAAAARTHPRVLLGLEVDYVPEAVDETLATLLRHRFDYVLCSVHVVDGFGVSGTSAADERWRDVDRVWRRYYETLIEAVGLGVFDVVAHLDLPKKWGLRPVADLTALEDRVLAAVATAGMAVEINTSGLDLHPVGEMYPAAGLLRRARLAGIPVTFGSDAHRAVRVGSRFDEALVLARAAGYTSFLRLSDRSEVPLPPAPDGSPGGATAAGAWPGEPPGVAPRPTP